MTVEDVMPTYGLGVRVQGRRFFPQLYGLLWPEIMSTGQAPLRCGVYSSSVSCDRKSYIDNTRGNLVVKSLLPGDTWARLLSFARTLDFA